MYMCTFSCHTSVGLALGCDKVISEFLSLITDLLLLEERGSDT